MQTVYLNGGIAQFGAKWSTNCANIGDVFKLIECQTPGFRKYLVDAAENNVGFEIQRGEEFLESEKELLLSLRDEDIIITEVPAGAKDGASKILAAVAILVVVGLTLGPMAGGTFAEGLAAGFGVGEAGAATAWYVKAAAMVAVNLALQGVTQLLAPGPETDSDGENAAYLFDGPITNAPEGMAIPVLYGELIVGGRPVSIDYRERSPFSELHDIDTRDSYVDPTGAENTTSTHVPTSTDDGLGMLPANDSNTGLPLSVTPTTQPRKDLELRERREAITNCLSNNLPTSTGK